jgi:3-hydroxy-9,10-secoandrosta-1,3,5(10)-triene-9,17-dione monooxygenase
MLMLPKSDYQIEDVWFVSGLRGTGSKDIILENAFVPNYRSVLVQDLRGRSRRAALYTTCPITGFR